MFRLLATLLIVFSLVACTATGDSVGDSNADSDSGSVGGVSGNKNHNKENSSSSSEDPQENEELSDLVNMVKFPAVSFTRGAATFTVDAYSISTTEVTQGPRIASCCQLSRSVTPHSRYW